MASESWKQRYNSAKSKAAKRDEEWEASRPKPLPTVTRVNKLDVQDERAAQSRERVSTANQRMANLSAKQSGLLPLGTGERMEDVNSELSALRHEQDLVAQYNNDTSAQIKRGLGYGTERAGSALLGAAEGITDIIGSGFYGTLAAVSSLGGLAPNAVSDWAMEQGNAFLDNSVTQDWEKSIEERYKPTDAERKVTGVGQSVTQMLLPVGASAKTASALSKGAGAINAARNAQVGSNVGQALFGLQAAGGAASRAKQEGADLAQSLAYGASSGLMESIIERVSGGIPGLGKGVLDDVASKVASNPVVRQAVDVLGEGGEEAVSAVLDPYIRRAIYDPSAENATPEEIAEAAIMGAVSAGVLKAGIELPGAVSGAVSDVQRVRQSVGTNEDIVNRVNQSIAEGAGPFLPYDLTQPVTPSVQEAQNIDTTIEQEAAVSQPVQPMVDVATPVESSAVEAPAVHPSDQKMKKGVEVPIAERTWEDASNRKVNAFQYDHPELRPYYQQAARELQNELLSGTKGERFAITDADGYVTGYTGTKRDVSEPIAQARDNANLSYEQIQKAIDDLIVDNGQENYAAAKKVEMILDDMLTNGYTDASGQYVEPNEAYVAARDGVFSTQQEGDNQYRMSEEEWNSILSQYVPEPSVSPESSVGAAAYGFDPYTNLQGQYGTIRPGENPSRVIDVPSRTAPDNKVSLTARTVMEAAATPESALPEIAQMVVDGNFSYIPVSNQQRAEMAENRIKSTGYADALSNWRGDVRSGKTSPDIVAMGAQLYNAAVNSGNTKEAMDILYDYTTAIRASAQATQAARILKTLTPSGRLYLLQKEVNNLNDKLSEKKQKRNVSAEDNVPVELWMQRVGETLADRLASRVNAPKETVQTVAKTVLSDLQKYANETAPKSLQTGKKRTEMDRIMDLFQNRTAYEEAWQAAKDTLSDRFENNPDALAAFDDWLDSSLDYTKRLTKELTKQDAIVIDEALADAYLSAQTEQERQRIYEQIEQSIANQIPSTFSDKFNAWRYISMLANPRTHIRNVVGNVGFQPVRVLKDEIAASIESVASMAGVNFERSKTFAASPDLYAASFRDYQNVADSLSGSKYGDVKSEINDKRRIYKSKALEGLRTKNSNALELEDMIFKRITYADSLSKYLQANGVTAEQLNSNQVDQNLLDRARSYAGQQALKATYQDRNMVSDTAVRIARGLGPFGEAVMPFKRTPANILVRAIEYSPIGLVKSLTADMVQVKQGKKSVPEAIDNVSAGITGTGLFALGVAAFMSGAVSGSGGDDETQSAIDDLTGGQSYAWNLPDGTSVTLDWLAPEAMPFFMGVRLAESLGENGLTGDSVLSSVGAVAEPMLEMSMLQSVNDLIDSVSYVDSTDKLTAIAGSAVTSYFSQLVPTVLGQAERTGEDTRMTTYTDKSGVLPTDVQYALGRASARIPGVDFQQIPYVDAWGREESTGPRALNAFNNFLNPAYTSQRNVTPVDEEVQRLYDSLGESAKSVVPKRAEKSITVDGEKVNLSADQYLEYAKTSGQTAFNVLSEIIQTEAYKNMSDSDKVSVFEDVYKYAGDIGKMAVSEYKPEGITAKVLQTGVPADKYMVYYATADADGNNQITQGESAAALLPIAGLSNQEKGKIWQSQNTTWNEKKNPFTGALASAGISPTVATQIMEQYSRISNATYSGGSVARQQQTELSKYLDSLGLSENQRAVVDETYKFYTMFPADPIPYSIDTMSDAAQEKWGKAKAAGMSESDYLRYYPIVSSNEKGKTKEDKIRKLQEAGLSYAQANAFWNIIKRN